MTIAVRARRRKSSNARVLDLAKAAASTGDDESLNAFTAVLSQHNAIGETIAGVETEERKG